MQTLNGKRITPQAKQQSAAQHGALNQMFEHIKQHFNSTNKNDEASETYSQYWYRICEAGLCASWETFIQATEEKFRRKNSITSRSTPHQFSPKKCSIDMNLENIMIGGAGIISLCEFIKHYDCARSLNLSNSLQYSQRWSNSQQEHIFSTLCNHLIQSSFLQNLNLSYCCINDKNIAPICQLVLRSQTLTELILDSNNLGTHIQSPSNCNESNKQSKTMATVIEQCPALTKLCDAIVAAETGTLMKLSLKNNNIDGDGMDTLGAMLRNDSCTLKILDIGNNPITTNSLGIDGFADALKQNKSLLCLGVSKWYVFYIFYMGNLYLFSHKKKKLKLNYSTIDDETAARLESLLHSLKHNSTLTSCDLSQNFFPIYCKKTMAAVTRHNRNLKIISLENVIMFDHEWQKLAVSLKETTEIECFKYA